MNSETDLYGNKINIVYTWILKPALDLKRKYINVTLKWISKTFSIPLYIFSSMHTTKTTDVKII